MFKTILSENWASLNPVLQQHFGLNDGEEIKLLGELEVKHGKFIKLLMPLLRLIGALVPVEGKGFIVRVENKRIGNIFYWHREFKKDNKSYIFNSKMQRYENDMIEYVGFGIGMRMSIKVTDIGILFEDKGYVIKIGSKIIPIPLHLLMGRAIIEEFTNNKNSNDLEIKLIMQHPWFGFCFSYIGYFNLV